MSLNIQHIDIWKMFYLFLPLWLLLVTVIYVIYQRYFHPLARVPGPFLASLTPLWQVQQSRNGKLHQTMIALHQKYGKLVRTGPNDVSVSDPGAIKIIYGAGSRFPKSEFYGVIKGHRKFDLFAEQNEKLHGGQRKMVSRAYAMETLKDLEPYVNDSINDFLSRLEALKERSIDMGKWLRLFAADTVGEITFSKPFGFMANGQDDGTFRFMEETTASAMWLGYVPFVFWIHDRLMPYIGNYLGVNARHGGIAMFAINEVNARKERGSDRKDMLSKLFAVADSKPDEFDNNGIIAMAISNIVAGTDTTATTLKAIVYHLLKNPRCKERLIDEIDSRRAQGKVSDPVSLAEADSMPYVQAVLYEALRVHPALGFTLPRVVPAEGVTLDGHFIPGGTGIGMNAWVIHRNREIFGEDAEVFRPERWLERDNAEMKRYLFSFGGGARLCLGKNISWLEMSKIVPTLFMRFEIELTNPTKEWAVRNIGIVAQEGIEVRIKPRPMQV